MSPRARRWATRLALVTAFSVLFFVFGWVPFWLGGLATTRRLAYADRENAGLTPASYALPFEDVRFEAADGTSLSGWWVPAGSNKGTVVLVHGLNRSRIEMIKKVPFLHEAGWNALLFDLRHHGQSAGTRSSFGYFEKRDVCASAQWVRARSSSPVVVWGVSLGAASAVLAAAEDPMIAGVICDSTYRSLTDTVRHHMQLLRGFRWWLRIVPQWPVANEVLFWIGHRGGFDPEAVDVRTAAAHLQGRPALFVGNAGDRRMPPEIAFELRAAAGDRARVLLVPGHTHGGAYREGLPAYQHAVIELLDEVARPASRDAS